MEDKVKREYFVVRIGPTLRKVLDTQIENIKKETYNVCDSSDFEAGEIIAKKIMEHNLV